MEVPRTDHATCADYEEILAQWDDDTPWDESTEPACPVCSARRRLVAVLMVALTHLRRCS